MIVVDASVVLEILLQMADARAASEKMFDGGRSLHAPHLIDVELAQAIRRCAASGMIDAGRGRAALTDLVDLPIRRYPHDVLLQRIWDLRSNLTAYDATYVALAEALNAPLLTRDRRLAAAPGHAAKIELI